MEVLQGNIGMSPKTTPKHLEDKPMINDFEDFCTWMYLIVDDIIEQITPLLKRPGPKPDCSDSELITMAIVGECRGWDVETGLPTGQKLEELGLSGS